MGKHPTIRRVIEKDAALSTELAATLDRFGQTQAASKAVEAQAKQIERDFKGARQKIEIAGLSQALGQVLREQRRKLPDTRRYLSRTPRTGKRRSPAWAYASCSWRSGVAPPWMCRPG
ncbi:MAG: hypothetical protein ACREWE_00375 [Gammaproteobacteria bacterium]